jgi:hypothetical protein
MLLGKGRAKEEPKALERASERLRHGKLRHEKS